MRFLSQYQYDPKVYSFNVKSNKKQETLNFFSNFFLYHSGNITMLFRWVIGLLSHEHPFEMYIMEGSNTIVLLVLNKNSKISIWSCKLVFTHDLCKQF